MPDQKLLPIYELLLWPNCNNKCAFCHQRKAPDFTPDQKVKALQSARQFLLDLEYPCHLLLIGGELFSHNTPENERYELERLAYEIVMRMSEDKIGFLYLNTNLLYALNPSALPMFLNIMQINGLISRVKFTTSWDLMGRFQINRLESTFLVNLQRLAGNYPDLNIGVNVILTKQVCDRINEDGFEGLLPFSITDKIKAHFIPYIAVEKDDKYAPERADVFNAISGLIPFLGYKWLADFIRNFDLKQEKRLFQFDGNKFLPASSGNAECGHNINFQKCYSDSNKCFVCDLKFMAVLERICL